MATADHSQFHFAAERYALGELSAEETLQFEEHYFSCESCAADVEALSSVRAHAAGVLGKKERVSPMRVALPWWPRALAAQSALAALVCLSAVVSYQNLVDIPRLRESSLDRLQVLGSPKILTARRAAELVVLDERQKSAPLLIPNDWPEPYRDYRFAIKRRGQDRVLVESEAPGANSSALLVAVPVRKLGPGSYELAVTGVLEGGRHAPVTRFLFRIQENQNR